MRRWGCPNAYIEKTLLFFSYNEWLGKPYKMAGLLKLYSLLKDCTYRDMLANDYGLDDRLFHQKMAEIDVLLPKVIIDMDVQIKHLNKILSEQKMHIENQSTHIGNLNHAIAEKAIHIEDLLTHINNIEAELLNFQSSWYGKLRAIVQRQKQRYFIKRRNDA